MTPRASLPDIENEVMCVECGTALSVSQSPVADQERALIRRDIAAGKTKAQIKAHLVAEYGNEVLAEPRGGSFDWAAWAIPIALVVLATAGVAVAARRWRRARVAGGAAQASAGDGPPAATGPRRPSCGSRCSARHARGPWRRTAGASSS